MFDFNRFTELIGDLVGNERTGSGLDQVLQDLGDYGIDTSQLEGVDSSGFLSLLEEKGIDITQLDVGQLSRLADELGIELPVGDVMHPFSGDPPGQ